MDVNRPLMEIRQRTMLLIRATVNGKVPVAVFTSWNEGSN